MSEKYEKYYDFEAALEKTSHGGGWRKYSTIFRKTFTSSPPLTCLRCRSGRPQVLAKETTTMTAYFLLE